jgi:altronate hydrolase
VVALTHKTGCGMASEGEGMELLRRTLAAMPAPEFLRGADDRPGLRGEPDQRPAGGAKLKRNEKLQAFTIQETGGTPRR